LRHLAVSAATGVADMANIPVETLRQQDELRQLLMSAIVHDDPVQISTLVQRGAPLYPHYYHKPTPHVGPPSIDPHFRDLGLVNPVDWAALELRFRAAMQLLELGDSRPALTEARPRPTVHGEIRLAIETKVALNLAALHGHLGLMRMLLERGAFVGQINLDGVSALHAAVYTEKPEAVALLLQYGAWDAEKHRREVIELAWARSMTGAFTTAGIPLEVSAAENLQSTQPQPTRSIPDLSAVPSAGARREEWLQGGHSNAVMQGHVQKMSLSPRPDGIADWGWAPFQTLPSTRLAAAGGGAVSLPRSGLPVVSHELNTDEVKLRGELTRAIRKGELDQLRGLMGRGAPLEAAFDLGYGEQGNCLDWACVSGRPESALVLLELADAQGIGDALAVRARAALFWSVSQGYAEVLRELLRRGADVGQPSPLGSLKMVRGETLLAAAVFGVRKAETIELLKHGAWEKEPESQRQQLLAWASGRRPVAEAFHEAGICDFSVFLAPLDLPYREHGVWEPNYPPPPAIHWEEKQSEEVGPDVAAADGS